MELMSIGEFGRAAGLSPKALRLYDDLALLTPARVDPASGYRWYGPAQLERARLVAWLRRLGMPLAGIREVCDGEPAAAAARVAAYWRRVEAETGARRELAALLIDHLSGRDTAITGTPRALGIRYAVRTDTGHVRPANADAAYAGPRLLAVADGIGDSDLASSAAIEALRPLDGPADVPAGDLLAALDAAVRRANEALRAATAADPALGEIGTTLTAMVLSGPTLGLVHIGDTRVYLLRGGELFQITHDHTLVQSMVDAGSLTPEEAASHPRRALLIRALDGRRDPEFDTLLREAAPGDRYLLCSDGLSAVVDGETIHRTLAAVADPDGAVRALVDAALNAGAPDNVTCVVADVTGAPVPA